MRRTQRVLTLDVEQHSNEKIFEMLRSAAGHTSRPGRDPLGLLFRRSMLWRTERQTTSAWIEHVPFAFWLVDVFRPRVIVELGTYTGVSYSAMCQAVKCLGLATSCFAVDTWRGDEHAGFYSEDIYNEFVAYHDRHYGAFSRLARATFDEALPHFDDGSIDLLHIDGLHTYEAVRHDYESWLPKLAPNAIVMFHDTNVRERDFAVHRLWSELASARPHFEFMHGYGLGVLAAGADYPGPLNILFEAEANQALTADIRSMFSNLGGFARDGIELSLQESLARDAADSHINALSWTARMLCGPPRRILAGVQLAADYLLRRGRHVAGTSHQE